MYQLPPSFPTRLKLRDVLQPPDGPKNTLFAGPYKKRNQRQIAFSISWTHQEPCGLVGSSVILVPGVPGSNSTLYFSVTFFFSKWGQQKISSLSHERRWPPHKRASEVYKNLPAGSYREFLFFNLWPKYVLKWALGNRNLHKKFNLRLLLHYFTPERLRIF